MEKYMPVVLCGVLAAVAAHAAENTYYETRIVTNEKTGKKEKLYCSVGGGDSTPLRGPNGDVVRRPDGSVVVGGGGLGVCSRNLDEEAKEAPKIKEKKKEGYGRISPHGKPKRP